jgi:Zn-dependent metalloprotease
MSFGLSSDYGFKLLSTENDRLGMTHYRYQQTFNDVPMEGTMYIVHVKNNIIQSVNGTLFKNLNASRSASMEESAALTKALDYMHATKYRWESAQQEAHLKQVTGNAQATWYPKGEKMLVPYQGKYSAENYRLSYRFDIYADEPIRREYVYVDASTGEIVQAVNRIRQANSTATAVTKYSGNRNIITDSVNATTYRLRETGRGLGIETYNSQTTTNHPIVDFLDTDNMWNNVNAAQDEVATDAHWGAEITYDYYMAKYGRSSVDNAGQKLLSYVHFDVDLVNANWDGTHMNYGDGDASQGITPLTCLDVTGHEISHGVTEHTSNLNYQDESGAMNEAFSDCMGNSIRQFGKNNAVMNWLIGDEMGGTPFRDMSNPGAYGQPDTYHGTDWYTGAFDNGGVHTNSGVMNYWFYLLTEGGSGTNDNGDAYSITGLGLDSAAAICYRMNAVYLVPTSQYADARRYAIQAAIDLYGACTNAVIQTTNAWYAVGVGDSFSPTVTTAFSAAQTVFCSVPASVSFNNESFNAGSYTWDFGDGSPASTDFNPTHVYTSNGLYTVKLVADGGACGIDSLTQAQFVNINPSNPCLIWLPSAGTGLTQTMCSGFLYDNGGPSGNYLDQTESQVTIAPAGASTVTLTFSSFNTEETYDFLYVYDGPDTNSTLIGVYDGNNLPNGGTITSTGLPSH